MISEVNATVVAPACDATVYAVMSTSTLAYGDSPIVQGGNLQFPTVPLSLDNSPGNGPIQAAFWTVTGPATSRASITR